MGALAGREYVRASGYARGSRHDGLDGDGEYHDRDWLS